MDLVGEDEMKDRAGRGIGPREREDSVYEESKKGQWAKQGRGEGRRSAGGEGRAGGQIDRARISAAAAAAGSGYRINEAR